MTIRVLFYDADGEQVRESVETDNPMAEVERVLASGAPEFFDANGELTVRFESGGQSVPASEVAIGAVDLSGDEDGLAEARARSPRRRA